MVYSIQGGVSKDILVGDAIEIEQGVIESVTVLVAVDVSDANMIQCGVVDFNTMQISSSYSLSPSWIKNVWRPI